jgi:hypothetical protein
MRKAFCGRQIGSAPERLLRKIVSNVSAASKCTDLVRAVNQTV